MSRYFFRTGNRAAAVWVNFCEHTRVNCRERQGSTVRRGRRTRFSRNRPRAHIALAHLMLFGRATAVFHSGGCVSTAPRNNGLGSAFLSERRYPAGDVVGGPACRRASIASATAFESRKRSPSACSKTPARSSRHACRANFASRRRTRRAGRAPTALTRSDQVHSAPRLYEPACPRIRRAAWRVRRRRENRRDEVQAEVWRSGAFS